jgi:hypothetical protein
MIVTLESLLEKGYFPREIPPPFHTKSYGAYAAGVGGGWNKKVWRRCATHNLARPGGLRRPLGIPNPISYFELARVLSANWKEIYQHT